VNTVLRSLFVWLLMLALPVQGLAAARMLPSASAPAAMTAAHLAAPAAHHCHDMPAATAAKAAGGDHRDKHHGACPGCCVAVALTSAPLVPPAFAPPSFAIPFRAGHVASVDPVLPERPPRRRAA
jgi:hypothetical protein